MPMSFYQPLNDPVTIGMTHRRWKALADKLEQNGVAPALVAKIRACLSDRVQDAPMAVEIVFSPAVVAQFVAVAQSLADTGT